MSKNTTSQIIEASNMQNIDVHEWMLIRSSNSDSLYRELVEEYLKYTLRGGGNTYNETQKEEEYKDLLEQRED